MGVYSDEIENTGRRDFGKQDWRLGTGRGCLHLEREKGGKGGLFRKTYPTNTSIKSKQLIIIEGSNRFNFTRNFVYIEIVSLDFLGEQANKQSDQANTCKYKQINSRTKQIHVNTSK